MPPLERLMQADGAARLGPGGRLRAKIAKLAVVRYIPAVMLPSAACNWRPDEDAEEGAFKFCLSSLAPMAEIRAAIRLSSPA
jgi:hypothetical protein